jgi:hypothetical protein
MVMIHAARGGSVGIAPPVGAAVLLVRDGRAGRVVAWSQGGLLCRVRLDGGAMPTDPPRAAWLITMA